ncbi:hypothetical protein SAMN05518856_112131 [Paenibacillus sp. OK003]|nr:hypothetical protein SAMN05518856_112131 [Paenibacillus sp. OK003]
MRHVQLSIPVALFVENVLTSGEPRELIIDCLQRKDFSISGLISRQIRIISRMNCH